MIVRRTARPSAMGAHPESGTKSTWLRATRSRRSQWAACGCPRAPRSNGGGRSFAAAHELGTDAAGLNWRGRGNADTVKSFEFVDA
jgi:hypothetical protein